MQSRERTIKWVLFSAMFLVVPWPFYLIAVLEVEPIALMLVFSLMLVVLVLPQAALGAWLFHRISRALARLIAPLRARWPITAAAVIAILAVARLPLYGGGENLAGSHGKFHDLRTEVFHTMGRTTPEEDERQRAMERARHPLTREEAAAEAAAKDPHATLEGLGYPQVVVQPGRPTAIALTREQSDCVKTGKTLQECGVVIPAPPSEPQRGRQ